MEADAGSAHPVPPDLCDDLNSTMKCMKGTNVPRTPRCAALRGETGREVACTIYENRPSPCREFEASFFDGKTHNVDCDKARAKHGMGALSPADSGF